MHRLAAGHSLEGHSLEAQVVRRMRSLAGAALRHLLPLVGDGAAGQMMSVFVPPLDEFDVLLRLNAAKLPLRHLQLGASAAPANEVGAPLKFANVDHGRIGRNAADGAVPALVSTLRERSAVSIIHAE